MSSPVPPPTRNGRRKRGHSMDDRNCGFATDFPMIPRKKQSQDVSNHGSVTGFPTRKQNHSRQRPSDKLRAPALKTSSRNVPSGQPNKKKPIGSARRNQRQGPLQEAFEKQAGARRSTNNTDRRKPSDPRKKNGNMESLASVGRQSTKQHRQEHYAEETRVVNGSSDTDGSTSFPREQRTPDTVDLAGSFDSSDGIRNTNNRTNKGAKRRNSKTPPSDDHHHRPHRRARSAQQDRSEDSSIFDPQRPLTPPFSPNEQEEINRSSAHPTPPGSPPKGLWENNTTPQLSVAAFFSRSSSSGGSSSGSSRNSRKQYGSRPRYDNDGEKRKQSRNGYDFQNGNEEVIPVDDGSDHNNEKEEDLFLSDSQEEIAIQNDSHSSSLSALQKIRTDRESTGPYTSRENTFAHLLETGKQSTIEESNPVPTSDLPADLLPNFMPPGSNRRKRDVDSFEIRKKAEAVERQDAWQQQEATIDVDSVVDDIVESEPETTNKSPFFFSKANNKRPMRESPPTDLNETIPRKRKKNATKITPGCSFLSMAQTTTPQSRVQRIKKAVTSTLETVSSLATRRSSRQRDKKQSQSSFDSDDDSSTFWGKEKRATRKMKKTKQDPIELLSSSESEGETGNDDGESCGFDLFRVAIGQKLQTISCDVVFELEGRMLRLRFEERKKSEEIVVLLNTDTVRDCHWYTSDQETSTEQKTAAAEDTVTEELQTRHFLAMSVVPDGINGLKKFRDVYDPDDPETTKNFVVLDFRQGFDLLALVSLLEDANTTCQEVETLRQCQQYGGALMRKSPRRNRSRKAPLNPFVAGRKDAYVLVVYPFVAEPNKIELAAKGLDEASGVVLDYQEEPKQSCSSDRQRSHSVTIHVRDYVLLDPKTWLNDALLDFWMLWISRGEALLSARHHFFPSHFYTQLDKRGPDAVLSWTRKIELFEKKLIFIPINRDSHWSLVVLVNPGGLVDSTGKTKDSPLSCLIFFDSLNMHNKHQVSKKVRQWLNKEWKTRSPDSDMPNLFTTKSFKLFSPKVPTQTNMYDCGVFVCRYAYAVYQMRHHQFTYEDAGMYTDEEDTTPVNAFYNLITDGDFFQFDMDDIARFRKEFKTLLERLSVVYSASKSKKKELRKPKSDNCTKSNELDATANVGTTEEEKTGNGILQIDCPVPQNAEYGTCTTDANSLSNAPTETETKLADSVQQASPEDSPEHGVNLKVDSDEAEQSDSDEDKDEATGDLVRKSSTDDSYLSPGQPESSEDERQVTEQRVQSNSTDLNPFSTMQPEQSKDESLLTSENERRILSDLNEQKGAEREDAGFLSDELAEKCSIGGSSPEEITSGRPWSTERRTIEI